MNVLDRIQVSHMAQMQNMFDFPPAPKLDPVSGRLSPARATQRESRGEQVFFGKGQCGACIHIPGVVFFAKSIAGVGQRRHRVSSHR